METTLPTKGHAHRSPVPLAAVLWVAFIGLALFIHKAVGCGLAGCTNATVALVAGLTLALGLGAVMTYADHNREREIHH